MGATGGRLDPSAQERVSNDGAHTARTEKAAHRSLGAQEDPPTVSARSTMPQVCDDRIADILRQRELTAPASLTSYAQGTRVPVDVLQLQRHDLPGTQSQSRQ